MNNLQVIKIKEQRVLTTKQIAEMYGTDQERIRLNYRYNKKRFEIGKHVIPVTGAELKELKRTYQNDTFFKQVKHANLWTEKGALLHAKSLNTDKAWEAYEYLVDFYFRVKENSLPQEETRPAYVESVNQENNKIPEMKNAIGILKTLLDVAEETEIKVKLFEFKGLQSALYKDCIGIKQGISVERAAYELAWELAHYFIHYNVGDIVKSPLMKEYNDQAKKAACMIIKILNVAAG